MGCFNMIGCISGTTIRYEDDIVVLLAEYHPQASGTYICDNATPISLPIYGKYNDYGGIEDVVEDDNVKWLEEHVGKIEDIMEAFFECQDEFTCTIGKCLKSRNQFHPEPRVKYVYENILKLSTHFNEKTQLCLLFEHKELYEEWAAKESENHLFEDRIKDYYKEEDRYKEGCKGDNYEKQKVLIDELHSLQLSSILCRALSPFVGPDSEYSFLGLYRQKNPNFLLEHTKEVTSLQNLIIYMYCAGLYFYPPVFGSQDDRYEDQIEYYKTCLKFLEKKKKEFDEWLSE